MSKCCSLVQLGDKIIDRRIFTEYFACDLTACRGACCYEGASGAPVAADEIEALDAALPTLQTTLTPEHYALLQREGVCYRDNEGDWVTTLVEGKACAFAVEREGCYWCGIELAQREGKLSSCLKPISCSLYPIRAKQTGTFTLLRYDVWEICLPACRKGRREGIRVYEFLRAPLIRAFGEDFYVELAEVGKLIR